MNNIFKAIIKHKLKNLAKIYLWRVQPQIVIIAGSTNRHSFKKVLAEKLQTSDNDKTIRISPDNHNAELGVPLSILGLQISKRSDWFILTWQAAWQAFFGEKIQAIILEIAINKPNDMDYLLKIFTPQAVIITNIEAAYLENFGNLDNIALEYKKLIQAVPQPGLVILNNDDQRVQNLAQFSSAKVITFGITNQADYQAKNIIKTVNGQEFELAGQKIQLNKFGEHSVLAELASRICKDLFFKNK